MIKRFVFIGTAIFVKFPEICKRWEIYFGGKEDAFSKAVNRKTL